MNALEIIFYVLAIISLIIALMLSSHGNSGGINPIAGNDIELFKKTKDRGAVKVLQFILFILVFILIAIGIVVRIITQVQSSSEDSSTETTTQLLVSSYFIQSLYS